MAQLSTIKRSFLKDLDADYQSEYEARFFLLLEQKFSYSRLDYLQDKEIAPEALNAFLKDLEELKRGRPVQYLIGSLDFAGLSLKVDERALIPRPETEELVNMVLNRTTSRKRCIDLASGSGCIALALAQHYQEVYAIEVSPEALSLANENQIANDLKVEFLADDILDPKLEWPTGLDLVISNPPYVRELEKSDMESGVYDYEPEMALFVSDQEPLIFYEAISAYAYKALNDKGLLALEINRYLADEMKFLLEKHFLEVAINKDQFGLPRFAFATKKRPTKR